MTALVIGGGPAGAALATRLARADHHVVLLERETGPVDKVCGEFLSREGGLYLESLGVDLDALGAVPIDALRLYERRGFASVPLPFAALSLSRRVLDEALLQLCASAGAIVRRGTRVTELSRSGTRWSARLEGGSTVEATDAFLATGKHDLRSHKRPPGKQSDLVAFKMYWRLAPRQARELERHVELILFEGGYAGLQPVEDGRANLCLLVRSRRLRALGQRWDQLLAAMRAESPHLDLRLTGAEACWARPLALSAIPYGHVQRESGGLWRLGDQAAVIPSFAGDGMSIALHSAELAATTYLAGRDADVYQRRLARDVEAQVLLSTLLSHGMVRTPGQRMLGATARLWPGLLSSVALHTRVSDAALSRAREGPDPERRATA